MGYRLNRLDEPVFIAVSKPLLTEFGIHCRLESCVQYLIHLYVGKVGTQKFPYAPSYLPDGISYLLEMLVGIWWLLSTMGVV